MGQTPTSRRKQPHLRLVDSSIWIAFNRIGKLYLLLSLPRVGLSTSVHRELARGRDSLYEDVSDCVVEGIGSLELDENGSRALVWVLQLRDISQADAEQAAYAAVHWDTVVLYMRDREAEIAGGRGGADIRDHARLVEDMVALELIAETEGCSLMSDLNKELRSARHRRGHDRQ